MHPYSVKLIIKCSKCKKTLKTLYCYKPEMVTYVTPCDCEIVAAERRADAIDNQLSSCQHRTPRPPFTVQ